MLPSDIHFLLCEQHRFEMLAEAVRQRLLRQLPRKPVAGLWTLLAAGMRRGRMRLRARFEGAATLP